MSGVNLNDKTPTLTLKLLQRQKGGSVTGFSKMYVNVIATSELKICEFQVRSETPDSEPS